MRIDLGVASNRDAFFALAQKTDGQSKLTIRLVPSRLILTHTFN
jgi:hypothetical protein